MMTICIFNGFIDIIKDLFDAFDDDLLYVFINLLMLIACFIAIPFSIIFDLLLIPLEIMVIIVYMIRKFRRYK